MRKQTKLVAVASAAALLAIGASMTSFAATGWVEEGGEWFYYEKDGTKAEDVWKKSGDKWFWLDSEESGAMAIDKLVEDGDNTYYVDSTGAMVSNTWVKVVNEEQDDDDDPAEYNYFYMQSNGKAYKAGDTSSTKFKTIDGKRYAFDEEGKMLYGWVSTDGTRLSGEDDWAAQADMYYCGNWDDGAMKTGWQKIYVHDEIEDEDMEHWFYFKSNGKKEFNAADSELEFKEKKVNGKKYGFDDRGVMTYEWSLATTNTPAGVTLATGNDTAPSQWRYFSSPEDGARVTKGWFKVVAPSEDNTFKSIDNTFDKGKADDESEKWYYADGDGKLKSGEIAKIKGKYYAFAETGYMLNGLVFMQVDSDGKIVDLKDDSVDADELDDIMDLDMVDPDNRTATLYYFGSDEDNDGSMKTGATTVTVDGDTHNFLFSKTGGVEGKGKGLTGIDDGKYIYKYGKKIKAGSDDKYKVVLATGTTSDVAIVDEAKSSDLRKEAYVTSDKNKDNEHIRYVDAFFDDVYLLNSTGTIVKSKTAAKDGDEWYFYVADKHIKMYTNNKSLPDSLKGWKEFETPSRVDAADVDSRMIAAE